MWAGWFCWRCTPGSELAWAALLGTAFYYIAWSWSENDPSHLPVTVFFLALFFAGFAGAPFLQDSLSAVTFPIANAAATWVALMVLFGARSQHAWRPWVTVALAAACLLMASASRGRAALSCTNLGLGIFFITVAVPLEFHGRVVTLCWLGESLALVALAKAGSHAILRIFATAVLTVAAISLLVDWIAGTPEPLAVVANMHFATNLIGAVGICCGC